MVALYKCECGRCLAIVTASSPYPIGSMRCSCGREATIVMTRNVRAEHTFREEPTAPETPGTKSAA